MATSMLVTDVGDEMCWRQFEMLVTEVWQFSSPTSSIFQHYRRAPRSKRCHQYRNSVANTKKVSPT